MYVCVCILLTIIGGIVLNKVSVYRMRSVLQYHQGRCHSVLIMLLIYRWIYIDKPTLIKQGPVALRWHPAATMTPLIAILSLIDQLKSH